MENWKCDQPTNLLTGVGSRDAYASKNIAGRYSCWILPHFSTRHAGRDKLDTKTKIQKDDNFYSFSGFSLKSILSEQFFQVWSAQPSSRLVGSASDRFQSTHRPFSNHMSGWESKHHKARFEEACPKHIGINNTDLQLNLQQNLLIFLQMTCNDCVARSRVGKCPISNSHWQLQIDICPLQSSWHQKISRSEFNRSEIMMLRFF